METPDRVHDFAQFSPTSRRLLLALPSFPQNFLVPPFPPRALRAQVDSARAPAQVGIDVESPLNSSPGSPIAGLTPPPHRIVVPSEVTKSAISQLRGGGGGGQQN